ncbi:UDP-N-acetylglucosamine--N-acetylmuramyl-(pentapeptide) pyrophosphoryl-undecaprenol N-acetylglucosamine transferase MurG [Maioricimonas rarisocia]|uniref:UDP-N-acetylglucosamine--N-acetylmuramyl-(pentapeptide) pyrophosphoryl-undecaprenol N-acetylglucosamine transferase n=1 Tax=Maioricimonas rarisocia TaxID=2528026 RepID=A0A517Z1V3_9PLAN|nr:undecaprenyldiphospho-muramoylpentapeptide beta-N-acetylglucosaminyltransferase [Maioricimonas rarisocia]QDU36461.1 UDP-N-acetylglucosamine--N-acetylmuramyl-(pentapeptide) pyrophosphoryl-undecaprenol N-acetylglucosamine transferase MurG [Maioricimonas rarisocia]
MSGLSLVFASGGSGGHIFPAVAVAEAVRARNPRVMPVFAGSDRPIERAIAARHGYERFVLPAASLNTLWRTPRVFVRTQWDAYRQARAFLQQRQPAAVIGCGSFSGAPLVYAASRLGIPVILLEQNVIPGRATSWLSRRADAVCVSFVESCRKLPRKARTPVTGNPIRREIARLTERAVHRTGERPTLLILGGSQGARAVNNVVCSVGAKLRWLLEDWQVIHQTGWNDAPRICAAWRSLRIDAEVAPFFDDTASLYARADLVISRAGATTLAEVACAGLPSILVPYPHAARNHQVANALVFRNAGAATIVEQNQNRREFATDLMESLGGLLQDRDARFEMGESARSLARPNAAEEVVDVLFELTGLPAAPVTSRPVRAAG